MSSSLSRPPPLLILVPVRPPRRVARVRHPLSLSLSPSHPVVALSVANHEIRVARCRAAPRRCFLSDQINPRLLCPRYRCVASPGRAVRPYKTRYYCNTGRLIESFPDAFCGAVHYMRAHAQLQKAATPVSVLNGLFFFFPLPLFYFHFFTRLTIALLSRFRRRATIAIFPVAIFDATDSRQEILYEFPVAQGGVKRFAPKKFSGQGASNRCSRVQ